MSGLLRNKKAQAMVEIAIIGSLIILAFSYLILFTAKVNFRQLARHYAFKQTLAAAKKTGKSYVNPVFYQRMPNILDPYVPGSFSPANPSGSSLWSGDTPTDSLPDLGAKWKKGEVHEITDYTKEVKRTEEYEHFPVTHREVKVKDEKTGQYVPWRPEAWQGP